MCNGDQESDATRRGPDFRSLLFYQGLDGWLGQEVLETSCTAYFRVSRRGPSEETQAAGHN